jgi:hypothetical protein
VSAQAEYDDHVPIFVRIDARVTARRAKATETRLDRDRIMQALSTGGPLQDKFNQVLEADMRDLPQGSFEEAGQDATPDGHRLFLSQTLRTATKAVFALEEPPANAKDGGPDRGRLLAE